MANLMKLKAVVLLSGGLDSTTILAITRSEGFELITLSFDYGQRHQVELDRAQLIGVSCPTVWSAIIEGSRSST